VVPGRGEKKLHLAGTLEVRGSGYHTSIGGGGEGEEMKGFLIASTESPRRGGQYNKKLDRDQVYALRLQVGERTIFLKVSNWEVHLARNRVQGGRGKGAAGEQNRGPRNENWGEESERDQL